jgi:uncharacterized protein
MFSCMLDTAAFHRIFRPTLRVALLFVLSLPPIYINVVYAQPKPEAAPAFNVKENYTKYEYRIPMRDGKRLFTSVYVPKDQTKSYPMLMVRTPYGGAPYGADEYRERLGPSPEFDKAGYIFVFQDVRGRNIVRRYFYRHDAAYRQ